MLSDAKKPLEDAIYEALKNALYEAYMSQINEDGNANLLDAMKNHMSKASMNFSEKAASEAAPKIADAIYDFVKAIGITATPTTLMSPSGPVTGAINPTDFQIN